MQKFILYYLLIINAITFILYYLDKQKAKKNEQRIPEKFLHLFELLGGTPFAFVAQKMLRHKNKKWRYLVVFYFIVIVQIILGYFWITQTNELMN